MRSQRHTQVPLICLNLILSQSHVWGCDQPSFFNGSIHVPKESVCACKFCIWDCPLSQSRQTHQSEQFLYPTNPDYDLCKPHCVRNLQPLCWHKHWFASSILSTRLCCMYYDNMITWIHDTAHRVRSQSAGLLYGVDLMKGGTLQICLNTLTQWLCCQYTVYWHSTSVLPKPAVHTIKFTILACTWFTNQTSDQTMSTCTLTLWLTMYSWVRTQPNNPDCFDVMYIIGHW